MEADCRRWRGLHQHSTHRLLNPALRPSVSRRLTPSPFTYRFPIWADPTHFQSGMAVMNIRGLSDRCRLLHTSGCLSTTACMDYVSLPFSLQSQTTYLGLRVVWRCVCDGHCWCCKSAPQSDYSNACSQPPFLFLRHCRMTVLPDALPSSSISLVRSRTPALGFGSPSFWNSSQKSFSRMVWRMW